MVAQAVAEFTPRGFVAASAPEVIDRDDAVSIGEAFDDPPEVKSPGRVAMHAQDRIGVAGPLVDVPHHAARHAVLPRLIGKDVGGEGLGRRHGPEV